MSLSVEPTTACNLRCPECPSGLRSFTRPTGMLDPDRLHALLSGTEGLGRDLTYLNLYFQGEPYLHSGMDELVAIGKREGAWALDRGAPEAERGFLLNHLIHELLPPKGDGLRWANSDPVTGQAAWFDLRVRIDKASEGGQSEPRLGAQTSPVGQGRGDLAYGEEW